MDNFGQMQEISLASITLGQTVMLNQFKLAVSLLKANFSEQLLGLKDHTIRTTLTVRRMTVSKFFKINISSRALTAFSK